MKAEAWGTVGLYAASCAMLPIAAWAVLGIDLDYALVAAPFCGAAGAIIGSLFAMRDIARTARED